MPYRNYLTAELADTWLRLAIDNIRLEYPHMAWIVAHSPDDYAFHRELHPAFFGSFDWHSSVEMYWVAARLMRMFPGLPAEREAVEVISSLLTPDHIDREVAFCRKNPGFERPYGWGWLLKLQHELDSTDRPEAQAWSSALRPLADQLVEQFMAWLPKLTYAQRIGMHANTAFGLWLSLPYARQHAPELHELFVSRARDWFRDDVAYPFRYEPSGADFLSPGLTEAVLMRHVLSEETYPLWIEGFLPLESVWLTPATVSDPSDGQIAHLHGLNLSRAWALGELAAVLPHRYDGLKAMRDAHIGASIDAVVGSDYMIEHWVAAYALLMFTEPAGTFVEPSPVASASQM